MREVYRVYDASTGETLASYTKEALAFECVRELHRRVSKDFYYEKINLDQTKELAIQEAMRCRRLENRIHGIL